MLRVINALCIHKVSKERKRWSRLVLEAKAHVSPKYQEIRRGNYEQNNIINPLFPSTNVATIVRQTFVKQTFNKFYQTSAKLPSIPNVMSVCTRTTVTHNYAIYGYRHAQKVKILTKIKVTLSGCDQCYWNSVKQNLTQSSQVLQITSYIVLNYLNVVSNNT